MGFCEWVGWENIVFGESRAVKAFPKVCLLICQPTPKFQKSFPQFPTKMSNTKKHKVFASVCSRIL